MANDKHIDQAPTRPICELVDRLAKVLGGRNIKLALAESCTGGLLAAAIVANPRASGSLERGFVVYSVDAKCELLDLQRGVVEHCDGVSEDIARAMAIAALEKSHADLSGAITGFAGPREGEEEVGLVHVATAWRGGTGHEVLHLGDIGRDTVNQIAAATALEMLIERVRRLR